MHRQLRVAFLLTGLVLPLSAGAYSLGPMVPIATGGWSDSTAIGDVTGDGLDDLVVSHSGLGTSSDFTVMVFAQSPNGGFRPPRSYRYADWSARSALVLADLNADGIKDIVVGHGEGLTILLANGRDGFVSHRIASPIAAEVVVALDVDGDGNLDLVAQSWSDGARIFIGDGEGGIRRQSSLATRGFGYNDLDVADLDKDGHDDLVMMNGQGFGGLEIFLHDGSGGFRAPVFLPLSLPPSGAAIGDFNGDGRLDLAASRGQNTPAFLWLMYQRADGSFADPVQLASDQMPDSMIAHDMDGNGAADLMVMHGGFWRMGVYMQGGGQLFPEVTSYVQFDSASHYWPKAMSVGDLDSDGCPDLAVADYTLGVAFYRGASCSKPRATDLALAFTRGTSNFGLVASNLNPTRVSVTPVVRVVVDAGSAGDFVVDRVPPACVADEVPNVFLCALPSLGPGGPATFSLDFGFATRETRGYTRLRAYLISATPDFNIANNQVEAGWNTTQSSGATIPTKPQAESQAKAMRKRVAHVRQRPPGPGSPGAAPRRQ